MNGIGKAHQPPDAKALVRWCERATDGIRRRPLLDLIPMERNAEPASAAAPSRAVATAPAVIPTVGARYAGTLTVANPSAHGGDPIDWKHIDPTAPAAGAVPSAIGMALRGAPWTWR